MQSQAPKIINEAAGYFIESNFGSRFLEKFAPSEGIPRRHKLDDWCEKQGLRKLTHSEYMKVALIMNFNQSISGTRPKLKTYQITYKISSKLTEFVHAENEEGALEAATPPDQLLQKNIHQDEIIECCDFDDCKVEEIK